MKTKVMDEDFSEIISEFEKELMTLEGKTVLITGASGLIASYLVDIISLFNRRLEKPCKMILMNRHKIENGSRLSHLIEDPNISFVTLDVGKKFDISEKPNIIIHAASRANPTAFLADPIDTIDANVNATRTILEYAKDNPLEQFIFFSSAEVYGNPSPNFIPTRENYNGNVDCTHPYACYIESKRICETLCTTFFRKFNVPVKMLRILLAYGPGIKNDGKVISDFFYKAAKEKQIILKDDGSARRSFCYISDVIRAIFKIMFYGKNGEPYNIGHDEEKENVSILELAEKIAKISNGDVKVSPNLEFQKKAGEPTDNRRVNIDKIKGIGFEPKVSLDDGLKKLKRYYQEAGYL
ncbi:NAD-dependent epimerase/dehydratase family protein [Candidatus Pacearchaeota archaeon]|nr:NAD-dependent epimerase/dehydratase family protein [Candidatus Pacearchaeota archaeon]